MAGGDEIGPLLQVSPDCVFEYGIARRKFGHHSKGLDPLLKAVCKGRLQRLEIQRRGLRSQVIERARYEMVMIPDPVGLGRDPRTAYHQDSHRIDIAGHYGVGVQGRAEVERSDGLRILIQKDGV